MGSLAILSEGYEGALGIYNCSFINQPREIFSTLKNDVQITNGLFWNSSGIPHFIKSDNTNSSYTFKISKSFIPNFEQSPITMMSNYTVVDTIYSGETMLQLDTERNLYLPGVLSPLVNAGNDDIRMLENFVATDLLGNPRYCGSGIDIGAIEVMKPEISIGDSLIGFDEDILIDFGNVPVFEEVVQHLRIANIGTMPLILSDPVFPEGYMAGSNISFPYTIETAYVETTIPIDIDEGDFEPEMEAFVDIPIVFHPTLHTIDYMNKFISFSTNDSLNSSVSISVNGVGLAAELSISDSTLVMADFPANNTPSFGRDFLIFKNTGNIGLVIDTLKVSHSDNSLAFFEYAATSDTPEENKQSGGTSFEKDMRGAKAQSAVPQSRSKQITDRRGSGLQRSLMLKREPSKGLSDLTWYGAEHNHIIELAPGDSIFVHTRYIPFLIGADSTKINVRSNDAYKADRTISLFGEGIPLVVTDNPTETQVSNVIMADTLWSCPQIEVKSSVQVSPQARLTIRPYKDAVSVQSDSTCCFNVSGELHARKSLNQLFSISFAGVDSLAGWKGLVFKNNDSGISRLDSLIIINANDHSRLEEGGGAIHSYEYCSILLSNVTIETSNSLHDGGAIYVNNGEVQIHECTISNSTALNGGAIAAMGAGSEVLISESTFDGNAAEQLGGVLYANNATISINAAQISDNSATSGGVMYADNATISINAAQISDNSATSGGVMYLENADLNFMDSACSGNTAVYGGVVSTSGDLGNIIISSSEFNQNGDSSCYGGSIYHAGGQLTINNGSSFSQNAGLCGGAIALEGLSALLTVSNAVFDENTAITHGGAITSNGGSVGVENSSFDDCSVEAGLGGAIALFESDYLISGNRFTHCLTDSVSGKGGSIYIENTPAQKSKGQTKFATNQRELSSNEIKQSNAYAGGAIYQNGSGDIISNAIFQNTASQGAGLYLKSIVGRFENNTIADNNASVMGWAMVCDSLAVTIKNTIIWRDTLAYISPIHCINAQDIDLINCAIMDTLDVASGTYASVSTYNCVTDNPEFVSADIENYQLGNTSRCVNAGTKDSALDGVDAMGNPRINANNGTPIIDMGAYEFVEPYWVCTRDTIPDYVEITYSPTHFFNDLQVTNTGTLHVDPGVSLLAQNNSMIMVSGSIEALGTENSGIVFSTTPGNDAWYGFSFKGEPSMGSSAFTHCAFLNGKAYPDGSHSGSDASNGGLMYIDGYPSIQIDYCSFSVNQALDNGGALYLTNLSPQDSLQITNSTFSGNRVKNGTGGAVCSMDSKLHLLNNSFGSNSAGYPLDTNVIPEAIYDFCGGAVSLIKSKTVDIEHSISNNQFLANYAAGTGGGIYAQAGEQRIVGNQFIDSIALGADKSGICSDLRGGGAIGVVGGSISEISQNTFDSNYAYAGGAILNNGSVSNVADNTFTENKAQFGGAIQLINIDVENNLMRNLFTANGTADSTNCVIGGAIRVLDCSDNVEISLSKFSRNSSSEKGGAIAIQNSAGHILINNQISNNTADNGGGLYVENSEISLSNNTIAHNVGEVSGGGLYIDGSRLESINNLHWSNSAPIGFEGLLDSGSSMNALSCFIRQIPNAMVSQSGSQTSYTDCYGESDEPPHLINDMYNYNLKPNSPCVNTGNIDIYHTQTDLNYRNRVVGGRIDIGAYEYSGTTINDDPTDSLTVWNDTCITVSSPITLSMGKKLIIEDNVSVFFEENGSLSVQSGILETHSNVSFVSETAIPDYHITLKDAAPVTLFTSSILGIKLKADATFMNVVNSIFNNSLFAHNNQSLVLRNTEFSASNLDAVNTCITNDTLMVSITGSYFHDKPDSTAIRIYSYPNFNISDNVISNYYTGLSIFESGQGKVFSLAGNNIEGNQYGFGIQVYHSNIDMNSFGTVKNNYIGLGGLRNSSLYIAGNKEPPYQSFYNNYFDEMAFTHDSFPKDIKFNLIYDSLHPEDVLLRCTNCDGSVQHDVSYNYWNMSDPFELLIPMEHFYFEPIWDMEEGMIPDISADQDLFELAKYNLRIGHNDLAVIQFKDLIENYPDTNYKEEAAKLLMAASGSSSMAIYDLQHFYATEPNLHNEIGIEKLADYLVNYCNLKLEDYPAVIDWYEHIIANPSSEAEAIYAAIDIAYTYLLMNATDTRAQHVGKYSQYIPQSMQTFRRDLDGYINLLLQPTSISYNAPPVPTAFTLHQNYPNPFNPTTTIAFEIPEDAPAQLSIYNIRGQLVKEIRYESIPKGYHKLVWDGLGRNNRPVGSGVYLYRMTYQGRAITKKMCIIK